jgi:hypothetical protein
MTLADLDRAVAWARDEGWNPGLDDAAAFRASDPDGFLMGWIGDAPAACISAVRHAPGIGFVGLYIVRPQFRGQGRGLAIWRAGMARLDGGAAGLDGVPAQQSNYARSGFVLARRNVRWAGAPEVPARAGGTTPLDAVPFEALLAYDAAVAGYPRPAFLRAWTTPVPGRRGALVLRDGVVRGYGVIRECGEGAKLGPIFADDPAVAAALVGALAAATSARPLFIDAPEPNAAATALARGLGMTPVFETARMWRGPAPAEDVARTFGVATFELG